MQYDQFHSEMLVFIKWNMLNLKMKTSFFFRHKDNGPFISVILNSVTNNFTEDSLLSLVARFYQKSHHILS